MDFDSWYRWIELKNFSTRRGLLLGAVAVLLCLGSPSRALGYEGLTELGFSGGYSSLLREGNAPPLMVGGASFGANINHRLNDTFGVGVEFNFDRQPAFKTYETEVIDGDEPYLAWVESGTVDKSGARSVTLSVSYALDVMRIIPYLALGITGVQSYQETEESSVTNYVLGGRLNLGADYLACPYLSFGVMIQNDVYMFGTSDFQSRLAFLFKISVILDVSKFGIKLADW